MNIVQLYNLTLVHEALKDGPVRAEDINHVYHTIPNAPYMKSKKGKIKCINEYFDKIAEDTILRYLINKQIKPDLEDNGKLN